MNSLYQLDVVLTRQIAISYVKCKFLLLANFVFVCCLFGFLPNKVSERADLVEYQLVGMIVEHMAISPEDFAKKV